MLRRILNQAAARGGGRRRRPGVGGTAPGPGPKAGMGRPRRGGAARGGAAGGGSSAEMQRGAKSLLRGFSKRRKGL